MELRHFFENMVRREETASAFLATLLEYHPTFRREFLRTALGDPAFDDREPWLVQVEAERVDVTLESPSVLVLIEDKISAGAKQQEQLLRYYLAAVDRTPGKRIAAVYLAPGGMGMGEVEAVERSPIRVDRPSDVIVLLPWDKVAEMIARLPDSDKAWFARSGMDQIERAIERARQEKYPAVGDRALVRGISEEAHRLLSTRSPGARLHRWSGRDFEEIYTVNSPVTMWLDAVFEIESEPPFLPIGLVQADGIHVDVRSQIKLAGKVKRASGLGRLWAELLAGGAVEVPGVGRHELQPNKWFVHVGHVVGQPAQVSAAFADTGQRVLEYLQPLISVSADD